MNKTYTEDDIKVLSDRDHVRLRLPVYGGNTNISEYTIPHFHDDKITFEKVSFVPAAYKCIVEIIDNAIDEFAQITQPNKILTITADTTTGTYTIADNGRGVPIGKHESGKHTPEVVFGTLRSGRNFIKDKQVGVIGMNGMGSAMTNFCSSEFTVYIQRDGKKYKQTFTDGALNISKPSIRDGSSKAGTEISFTLDKSLFASVSIPSAMMQGKAMEIAFLNPGITVTYNDTKYKYRKGLEEVVSSITDRYFKFELSQDNVNMEFFVLFGVNKDIDEQIFTWVNSSLLFDGGICNTQFLNAFYDKTIDCLKSQAKKQKCDVTKNDVREGLLVLANLKTSQAEYDAQSKTRLTGPNIRKEMADMVDAGWSSFARKNKQWLSDVLDRAVNRHHTDATKKAVKELQKSSKKKVPGLIDATSKTRFGCQVLITEGLSAAASLTDVRDPETTAIFPLSGKINNVHGASVSQLMEMGKLTNLLAAIGLVPGHKVNRSDLRFGKIVIATDADQDGGNIYSLLVNMLYQFWPSLFDPSYDPIVYRLSAPNVCLVKGKHRVHFVNRSEYEANKDKYKGYVASYFKGLGSLERGDWDMILSNDRCLIPIVDDGKMKETLELLFGPDADKRKQWLSTGE